MNNEQVENESEKLGHDGPQDRAHVHESGERESSSTLLLDFVFVRPLFERRELLHAGRLELERAPEQDDEDENEESSFGLFARAEYVLAQRSRDRDGSLERENHHYPYRDMQTYL